MYGTIARTRVKPENRDALLEVIRGQTYGASVPGFVTSYALFEDEGDTAWIFALFEDRGSYDRNADDPAQHERYVAYRALMEEEPEWHDGVIESL